MLRLILNSVAKSSTLSPFRIRWAMALRNSTLNTRAAIRTSVRCSLSLVSVSQVWGPHQTVPAGLIVVLMPYPGLTSWATLNRPWRDWTVHFGDSTFRGRESVRPIALLGGLLSLRLVVQRVDDLAW